MRGWIKRLEREAEGEMLVIPQHDGTVKRFPPSAGFEALIALIEGRDHPLARAARNSPDSRWSKAVYNAFPVEDLEDLSE